MNSSKMSSAVEVSKAYWESLEKLVDNNRIRIGSLTELAFEYSTEFAPLITKLIEERIRKTQPRQKLPCMYLMDSVVKNHPKPYKAHFEPGLIANFSHVFEVLTGVPERKALYKLRTTWKDVFSSEVLNQLDVNIHKNLDENWPVLPVQSKPSGNIHINPAVFGQKSMPLVTAAPTSPDAEAVRMAQELQKKKKELMELQKMKTAMELQKIEEEIAKSREALSKPATKAVKSDQASKTVPKVSSRDPRASAKEKASPAKKATPAKSRESSKSPGRKPAETSVKAAAKDKTPPPPTIRGEIKKSKKRSGSTEKSASSKRKKESNRSPSSSPSPPPLTPDTKKNYRIPKKGKGGSPTTEGFREEGPHVEFNDGKRPPPKRKGGDETKKQASAEKKSKLNSELFGEDSKGSRQKKNEPPVTPQSAGWAKFKESNPDEFRTPMQRRFGEPEEHQSGDRGGRGGRRNRSGGGQHQMMPPNRMGQQQMAPNHRMFPHRQGPFAGPMGPMNEPLQFPQGPFGELLNQMHGSDPAVVVGQVIPHIINQARESLNMGTMSPEQFADLMRQVMILKESAMMMQADRRHENKENRSNGPWEHPPPWERQRQQQQQQQLLPFAFMQQQQQPRPPMPPVVDLHRDLPLVSPEDMNLVERDPFRSIPIDEQPRDIRFYGEVATCVLGDDKVCELFFNPGSEPTRNVVIDMDEGVVPPLPFNNTEYTDFILDGVVHKIKIGAPTRELWVDGQPHQLLFGTEKLVEIGQKDRKVYLGGPMPDVKIGIRRPDLCAGYVQLIIDGDLNSQIRLYLDAKPQLVIIGEKPHVIRFADKLATIVINGQPFKTEFGGVPIVIYVHGIKHFLRLSALPKNVRVGKVLLRNMIGNDREPDPPSDLSQRSGSRSPPNLSNENSNPSAAVANDDAADTSAFDKLLSLFPSSQRQASKDGDTESEASYKCDEKPAVAESSASSGGNPTSQQTSPAIDVGNLWEQLLASGLVTSKPASGDSAAQTSEGPKGIPGIETVQPKAEKVKPEEAKKETGEKEINKLANIKQESEKKAIEEIKPIVLKSHDPSLKERQLGILNMLYSPSALQCKNCGLRYSPTTDMVAYSQHLDWHFRMKRREKDNAKKAQSRHWYFAKADWIISEEIEDISEDGPGASGGNELTDDSLETPTVAISDNAELAKGQSVCPVCQEEFATFFKQPQEGSKDDDDGRWHYFNAVKVEERVFHPQCYQDHLANPVSTITEAETLGKDEHAVKEEEPATGQQPDDAQEKPPVENEADNAQEQMETDETKIESEKKDKVEDTEAPAEAVKEEPAEDLSSAEAEPATTESTADSDSVPKEGASEVEVKEESGETTGDKEEEEKKNEESLDKSLNDDHKDMAAASVQPVADLPSIKINITTPQVERAQRLDSTSEEAAPVKEESEYDPDAIIQEAKPEQLELKPRLKDKKLVLMPPQNKGSDLSGLCSIM